MNPVVKSMLIEMERYLKKVTVAHESVLADLTNKMSVVSKLRGQVETIHRELESECHKIADSIQESEIACRQLRDVFHAEIRNRPQRLQKKK